MTDLVLSSFVDGGNVDGGYIECHGGLIIETTMPSAKMTLCSAGVFRELRSPFVS